MRSLRLSWAWLLAGVGLGSLGFLLVTGQPFSAKAQEPKRFQYAIVEVLPDTENMQIRLTEYGENGWELVTVSMGGMTKPRLIFKK